MVQKIFCLPYLPHPVIGERFNFLFNSNTDAALIPLFSYIRNTWIEGHMWGPESWSGYGRAIRTNNDAEGLHNRWIRQAKAVKLDLYALSELLFKEAKLIPVQKKLVAHNKLRQAQRKETREFQGRIFVLWDQYETNGSVSQLHDSLCRVLFNRTHSYDLPSDEEPFSDD